MYGIGMASRTGVCIVEMNFLAAAMLTERLDSTSSKSKLFTRKIRKQFTHPSRAQSRYTRANYCNFHRCRYETIVGSDCWRKTLAASSATIITTGWSPSRRDVTPIIAYKSGLRTAVTRARRSTSSYHSPLAALRLYLFLSLVSCVLDWAAAAPYNVMDSLACLLMNMNVQNAAMLSSFPLAACFSDLISPVSVTDIQGPAFLSPLSGKAVSNLSGLVTAKVCLQSKALTVRSQLNITIRARRDFGSQAILLTIFVYPAAYLSTRIQKISFLWLLLAI